MEEVTKENSFTSIKHEIDRKKLRSQGIILKLDVNGAEWMALKTLPLSYLERIDQMVVNFHNPRHPEITPPVKGHLVITETLRKYFVSVNLHMDNNYCVQNY